MEEWRDIDGFPGYQVSNTGKVRSYINNRHGVGSEPHELKQCTNALGYKSVQLGRKNRRSVHRLVADAYIDNPDDCPLVRHLDDDPSNNHMSNLAWGNQTDNMQDCVAHGRLVGDTSYAVKARKRGVIATSKDGNLSRKFESIQDAARSLGVWPQHICNVLRGKISQTGGWSFQYAGGGDCDA